MKAAIMGYGTDHVQRRGLAGGHPAGVYAEIEASRLGFHYESPLAEVLEHQVLYREIPDLARGVIEELVEGHRFLPVHDLQTVALQKEGRFHQVQLETAAAHGITEVALAERLAGLTDVVDEDRTVLHYTWHIVGIGSQLYDVFRRVFVLLHAFTTTFL